MSTDVKRALRASDRIGAEVVTGDYVCPRCDKRGDTEKGLRAHLLVIHGERT